jgi:phage tail sheath protein FI
MPSAYTYPGVYVEEVPSGVRSIAGVSTSDTAFIDFFARGPMNEAVRVTGMEDFNRRFGGVNRLSEASYALRQYYLNGGQIAWVVRVADGDPRAARYQFASGGSPASGELTVEAASPGVWAKGTVQVGVDHLTASGTSGLFNLIVRELDSGRKRVLASEVHRNLSTDPTSGRFVKAVIAQDSDLIRIVSVGAGGRPAATAPDVSSPQVVADPASTAFHPLGDIHNADGSTTAVSDGLVPGADALTEGLAALEAIAPAVFNLLCLPAASNLPKTAMNNVLTQAAKFCEDKRAFLIVDPHQSTGTLKALTDGFKADAAPPQFRHRNAALYFPRVEIPDPLNEGRPRAVGPSGTMAGVYARTDARRGVWKAPAGADDGRLAGVTLRVQLTDLENGQINPVGVNVLRTFPIFGNVAWGARTLDGADQQASEWKYIPIRRTALYIEESLSQGLKWVVFEPNDEPLWSQIRLNVGAFMHDRFRLGAFQGITPREAYFVKCDAETTTQSDIDRGIVNILVGFAPLKPAEFVVIRIQQIAGQIDT